MAKRKQWTKIIEEHGVRIRLFERAGTIYRDVTLGRTVSENGKARTDHDVKSLKHADRAKAETQAKALAAKIAEARLTGATPETLTIGQLFAQYRKHKLPTLDGQWQRSAKARMALFERAWGRDMPVRSVDQTRVAEYCRKRRALDVVSPGLEPTDEGEKRRGYRKPKPVRDGTLDAEFRWLHSAFAWACDFTRPNGEKLLASNPLPKSTEGRRAIGWPKERNPLRPVASHDRYVATMARVDSVDPKGRLRAITALARFTGRRESAICNLRASDLLLSGNRVRATLAAEGMDERLAEHMPHGAIRWAAEHDKQGLLFVTALSADARAELDRYRRLSPRMGDVPLFPAPRDASKAVRRETVAKWLLKAEKDAGLPKIRGGVFHPYRRLFASERRHLPDVDVAAAAGWSDPATMKKSYQRADAAGILSAVQNTGT
jgi:hypothetical protein